MIKSSEAFRTISEVSEALDTPAHVLRFWESRFPQIKPVKRAGGRRYYRPTDVALIGGIRKLLHDDGLTIRGVQKILKEKGVRHVASLAGIAIDDVADDLDDTFEASPEMAPVMAAEPPARAAPSPPRQQPASAFGVQHPVDQALMTSDEDVEAPILLDAPELPLGSVSNLRPRDPAPAARAPAETGTDAMREPAAALLRAMDALRARDKRTELRDVYNRLTSLRDRLSRDGDQQSR